MGAAASIEGQRRQPLGGQAPAPMKTEDDDWSWPGSIGTLHRARRRRRGRCPLRRAERRDRDRGGQVWRRRRGGGLAREVRRLKQLDENRIIAYGSNDEGRCLLASPLYEDSLADHVCGLCSRAAPAGAVARIVRDIAQALAHAHSLNIVHGDVKPANVARKHRSEPWVLLDWDDALDVGSRTSLSFFTELYAAPECLLMDELAITPSIDVWGLGATALEALTAGAHPLSSELDARGAGFASWLGRASADAVDAFWASFGESPVLDFVRTLCALDAAARPAASGRRRDGARLARRRPRAPSTRPRRRRPGGGGGPSASSATRCRRAARGGRRAQDRGTRADAGSRA